MKLGEIVVHHMDNYNFTKFHQNQMKNKKVLLLAYLTDVSCHPLWSCYGAAEFGLILSTTSYSKVNVTKNRKHF